MKTFLTTAFLLITALTFAQPTKDLPRTEFAVSLSQDNVIIKPGESKQITLSIARSKGYAKTKAKLGLLSSLPEGITINFEPKDGIFESSIVTITVGSQVSLGVYPIVLSAELNAKKKGSTLKLSVTNNQIVANEE